ncbi:MAG TPA: hypothetical protein ACN46X_04945, partial [Prochlorococcus sp.]
RDKNQRIDPYISHQDHQHALISHPLPGTFLPVKYSDWRAVDRIHLWQYLLNTAKPAINFLSQTNIFISSTNHQKLN